MRVGELETIEQNIVKLTELFINFCTICLQIKQAVFIIGFRQN